MFETVAKIIAEYKDIDQADIKPESTFEDLGVDSLDTVELIMNLEDETGIKVEMNEPVKNVAELVALLEASKA